MIIYNDSGEYTFNDGIQLRQSSEENSQVRLNLTVFFS